MHRMDDLNDLIRQPDDSAEEVAAHVATRPAAYKYQEGKAIAKVRYSHDGMIDLIVEDPSISQNRIAEIFGYTPAWVSLVMSSDAFKERLAARKAELVDPAIRATLEERFRSVVTRSLEVLADKLSAPSSVVPDALALRAAELGAKALGLGGNAPPPPVAVPTDHLDKLASRLLALQSRTRIQGDVTDGQIIEAQPVAVLSASGPLANPQAA